MSSSSSPQAKLVNCFLIARSTFTKVLLLNGLGFPNDIKHTFQKKISSSHEGLLRHIKVNNE